ncbi:unnamed protein product [Zymoseptoria tritici ST99CH_1E4]|uniref:Clr5 domain-containing protein n=1 Tax=Zymoseptoria tritici ST99CH_1E4 TaxID=1276532 RepID=A0A2H1GGU3_ZYMTR|nr:unnamed protein product [Zymoseptoria tritici ST99CH_1E4]
MVDIDWTNPEAVMQAMQAMGIGGDPTDGSPGGLPVPTTITPSEVRKTRSHRAASIFKNYHLLHGILERHEATIQKRWNKRSNPQKRAILTKAWGSKMPSGHRPDFQHLRKGTATIPQNDMQHRQEYMWPFINEEGLMKSKTLLLFLNARGRNSPADFAAADLESMHVGLITAAVMPAFLNEYVMVFTGRHDAEGYGELLHWDDHTEAFEWLMTKRCPNPGEGLLILESQDKIMSFLVATATEILHDISDQQLLDYPLQDPPPIPANDSGFDSLAAMASEAPYRVPARLSFSRIESLLAARRDAAADNMWALREDPAYYSELLLTARDHRHETLPDLNGHVHPLFRFGREEILWARVIANEITNAFIQLEIFTNLQEQAARLKTMQNQYNCDVHPEKDLPKPYLDAILRFRYYLKYASKGPIGLLKHALVSSPAFRSKFARRPEERPEELRIDVMRKAGKKMDLDEAEFLWLATILWEDGHDSSVVRLPIIVDELQRLVDTSAKTKSLVSSHIAVGMSDLAIITECLRQIDIYQPWSNQFEEQMVDRMEAIEKEFSRTAAPWTRLLRAVTGSQTALAKYGAASEGRFNYPIEKRRTRETTEAMQRAEANLDLFWRKVDEILHLNAGDLDGFAVKTLLHERELQRTPDWVEPTKSKPVTRIEPLTRPLSEVYFDLEQRTERTIQPSDTVKERTKRKTRPEPNEQQSTLPVEANVAHDSEVHPTFEVDQRALKVFRTLFYTPSLTGAPGEVSWTDFLHALRSVGFLGEKLYGSVWQFTPTKFDVERSIQFHEPHPSGKIPFWKARRHGRRLSRNYGWFGQMFSLSQKAVA